jgi:hypothetical protein
MVTTGIPLAGGLGLNSADATAAFPFVIIGAFFLLHGYLVYRGTAKVPPQRLWGFIDRPNIDLACAWLGAGFVTFGLGQILSVPPWLPIDIVGQVISWSGAPLFLVGVLCYVFLPKFMTPAWARTPEGLAEAAEVFAAAKDAAAAEKAAIAADKAAYLAAKAAKKAAKKGKDEQPEQADVGEEADASQPAG